MCYIVLNNEYKRFLVANEKTLPNVVLIASSLTGYLCGPLPYVYQLISKQFPCVNFFSSLVELDQGRKMGQRFYNMLVNDQENKMCTTTFMLVGNMFESHLYGFLSTGNGFCCVMVIATDFMLVDTMFESHLDGYLITGNGFHCVIVISIDFMLLDTMCESHW